MRRLESFQRSVGRSVAHSERVIFKAGAAAARAKVPQTGCVNSPPYLATEGGNFGASAKSAFAL